MNEYERPMPKTDLDPDDVCGWLLRVPRDGFEASLWYQHIVSVVNRWMGASVAVTREHTEGVFAFTVIQDPVERDKVHPSNHWGSSEEMFGPELRGTIWIADKGDYGATNRAEVVWRVEPGGANLVGVQCNTGGYPPVASWWLETVR